jgi:anti-anti-sigma factor
MSANDDTGSPPGAFTLGIEGELTIYRALELKGALLAAVAQHDAVKVDLSQVTEIDTAGVQLLLLAKRTARLAGKELRLLERSPAVVEVFGLLDLSAYFADPASAPNASGTGS